MVNIMEMKDKDGNLINLSDTLIFLTGDFIHKKGTKFKVDGFCTDISGTNRVILVSNGKARQVDNKELKHYKKTIDKEIK